ncbi:MAG TPA: carbamate kinase [Ilumatobacteraceae bacterium]|nr:carbamate kinase [Ilumatobacteraceae bacterium]
MSGLAVVALGGNALVRDKDHESIPDQYDTVSSVAPHLVDLIEAGWNVVVTHGNGPQVGFILRRSELASTEVAPVPIDYAVGDTQGAIGYMFLKALGNELGRRGIDKPVVALVTQTLVSLDDPAFDNPVKPVGAFMDEATARGLADELGWTIAEDAGRGWRRTVASPHPVGIVELPVVRTLCDQGAVVVTAGGGGIPVARDASGDLIGVEAVVDKDLTSALLAADLGADLLIVPTGVERVAVNFGTQDERWLDHLTTAEATELAEQGQFGEGSMRPKVEAVVSFVERRPGAAGLITSPDRLRQALERTTGTWIEAS